MILQSEPMIQNKVRNLLGKTQFSAVKMIYRRKTIP